MLTMLHLRHSTIHGILIRTILVAVINLINIQTTHRPKPLAVLTSPLVISVQMDTIPVILPANQDGQFRSNRLIHRLSRQNRLQQLQLHYRLIRNTPREMLICREHPP